jgi:hypothetical protein
VHYLSGRLESGGKAFFSADTIKYYNIKQHLSTFSTLTRSRTTTLSNRKAHLDEDQLYQNGDSGNNRNVYELREEKEIVKEPEKEPNYEGINEDINDLYYSEFGDLKPEEIEVIIKRHYICNQSNCSGRDSGRT